MRLTINCIVYGRYSEMIIGNSSMANPPTIDSRSFFDNDETSITSPANPIMPISVNKYSYISAWSIFMGAIAIILIHCIGVSQPRVPRYTIWTMILGIAISRNSSTEKQRPTASFALASFFHPCFIVRIIAPVRSCHSPENNGARLITITIASIIPKSGSICPRTVLQPSVQT